ncbi:hypothetical protein [Sphingosinicella sp.]|uniref:hypothetical protein n=1 Tax=Sphingosinicella sp. TaxID=1917971 RepID=UPI004037E0B7
MKQSGWSSIEVEINSQGQGRYRVSDFPGERQGAFSISPQQFTALVERLEPFQRQSEAMSEESITRMLEFRCPEGTPEVTDAGGFWVHWMAAGYDRHYSADFGCDRERNRTRNDELRNILRALPLPT